MGRGNPKYKRKETRVQIALAKFHGLGKDDPWTIEQISDHLNVDESTVSKYVNDTELGEEVEDQLAEAQARTRMRVAMKLMSRLDQLEEMIDEKSDVKKPQVISHKMEKIDGKVDATVDGYDIDANQDIEMDIPIPDHYKEVPKVDSDMKTLLREWRLTLQQIEDLLGLESPEQIQSEHREIQVEAKIWDIDDDDMESFPDQEVLDSKPNDPPAFVDSEVDE